MPIKRWGMLFKIFPKKPFAFSHQTMQHQVSNVRAKGSVQIRDGGHWCPTPSTQLTELLNFYLSIWYHENKAKKKNYRKIVYSMVTLIFFFSPWLFGIHWNRARMCHRRSSGKLSRFCFMRNKVLGGNVTFFLPRGGSFHLKVKIRIPNPKGGSLVSQRKFPEKGKENWNYPSTGFEITTWAVSRKNTFSGITDHTLRAKQMQSGNHYHYWIILCLILWLSETLIANLYFKTNTLLASKKTFKGLRLQ